MLFSGEAWVVSHQSGWKCDALPYLVEFDNFGISRKPGVADTASHFIWGYDEITWFYLLPEQKEMPGCVSA